MTRSVGRAIGLQPPIGRLGDLVPESNRVAAVTAVISF
jgi:hypothetical protein